MRTGSSDSYFTASTSRKHVTQVAEGSYYLQLIRSDLNFTLWPALNRAGISHARSELILGCGSVIITLFLQYWPKISSSLGSYFHTMSRFGAFPVILCVFLVILFTFRSL